MMQQQENSHESPKKNLFSSHIEKTKDYCSSFIMKFRSKIHSILSYSPKRRKQLLRSIASDLIPKEDLATTDPEKKKKEHPVIKNAIKFTEPYSEEMVIKSMQVLIEKSSEQLKTIVPTISLSEKHEVIKKELSIKGKTYPFYINEHYDNPKYTILKGHLLCAYACADKVGWATLPFTYSINKKTGKTLLLPGKKFSKSQVA